MNVVIHPVNLDASNQLVDFVEKKLSKLETFFDKIVEVKLSVPGKTLFVTETGKSFEESTDIAVEVISRQLKKHKGKLLEKH
jgi:putative sigma-54 modulation protein